MREYLVAGDPAWLFPTAAGPGTATLDRIEITTGHPDRPQAVVMLRLAPPWRPTAGTTGWDALRSRVLDPTRTPVGIVRELAETEEYFLCSRIRSAGVSFSRVATLPGVRDPEAQHGELARSATVWAPRVVDELYQTESYEPGFELETKQTVTAGPSPWAITLHVLGRSEAGRLAGFVPDLGNELQRWRYTQSTFALFEDAESVGYLAFMRSVRGWAVKEKLFRHDGVRRRERVTPGVDLTESDFEDYLRTTYPQLTWERLADLERARFDVNVESTATGHFFGIETDDVRTADGRRLRQVEVEYHKTRVHDGSTPDTVLPELSRLTALVRDELDACGASYVGDNRSKLTFLRAGA